MSKGPLEKKEHRVRRITKETSKEFDVSDLMVLVRSIITHDLGFILKKEISEKRGEESPFKWLLSVVMNSYRPQQSSNAGVERRLKQLEKVAYLHNSVLKKHEALIELNEAEEQREEQQWPAYTSEEFGKIVENMKGLENADEDKEQILYHIMEIETILEKIESKARATNREYEARLSASLRDICKIHEPSELSKPQIKCFTASLQALIEGWGQLNREKVKWIRGRLLEIGLTWLPVTEKAQKVIDEAKSSVK